MSKAGLSQYGLDRAESGDDVVVPFTLDTLDSRGRAVRLGPALDTILAQHNYPAPVARLLGEAVTLAALIGSSLKFEGKFILQAQTDGPVDLIVVDLDAPDGLRGYARFNAETLDAALAAGQTSPGDLLGKGHLAMTVDQGAHMERYQGIVPLDGGSLEEAAHVYFAQSEQLPTRVRVAVAEFSARGSSRPQWRAGGMMVQYLPDEGGRQFADLPGDGDFENDETRDPTFEESNNWTETRVLFDTITDAELADPEISPERALFRLFHESGVRVYEPARLEARCTCSADRIEDMLKTSFTSEDREEMTVDGQIEVTCEFCSTSYQFSAHHFETEH